MTKKAKASPKAAEDLLSQFVNAARQRYETDENLELEKGVDIEVDGVGTFTILRAHSRNPKFVKAYREKVGTYLDSAEAKAKKADEPDPKLAELNREVFAEVIIVGLKDGNGNTIPYDDAAKSAVKELLKVTPDLYAMLQADALNADNFRKRYEAEEKN